jgi:ATP-dependent Lon protease
MLEPEQLDACPFLGKRDNTYVMDLAVIPEKYRLDVKRAEQILNRALAQWLNIAEGGDLPVKRE